MWPGEVVGREGGMYRIKTYEKGRSEVVVSSAGRLDSSTEPGGKSREYRRGW